MPYNTLSYVAKFGLNSYTMSVSSEDTNKGTVTGGGTKTYTQSVSLTASPLSGYSFVGWFEGETIVSSANPYTLTMPYNNLTYVARFSTNSYQLTLASDHIEKGTVNGAGTYAYGSEVTITATPIEGNAFIGWFNGSTLVSENAVYIFNMPYNALSYTAKFVTKYHADVISGDETMGTVSGTGDYGYTTSVTITATPLEGYYFDAWYDGDFNKVTYDNPYRFTMPELSVTYYAVFTNVHYVDVGRIYYLGSYPQTKVTDSTLITTLNTAGGTLPTSANSQTWTSYGFYISGSNTTNFMWYKDVTNGTEKYRGVYFTSYRPSPTITASSTAYSFQDDNGYLISTRYWFKYEPIAWDVLSVNETGGPLIMADKILDSRDYYHSSAPRNIGAPTVFANNYKESNIRSWLNSDFYNQAFSATEQSSISTTTVDNSVASTGSSPNIFACADTSDKLFLPSYVEATNATYGLSTTTSRLRQATDYAKALGLYVSTTNGSSNWWLRSPVVQGDIVRYVRSDGGTSTDYLYYPSTGVLPAFRINL